VWARRCGVEQRQVQRSRACCAEGAPRSCFVQRFGGEILGGDGRAGERARNRAYIETHVMTQTRTQPGRSHPKAHRQGWMKLAHGPRASSSLTLQLDKEGCTHAVAASPSRPLPDRLCKALLCTQYFGTSPSCIHSSRCRDKGMPEDSRGVARARAFLCDAINTRHIEFSRRRTSAGAKRFSHARRTTIPHGVNMTWGRVWRTWGPASCPFLIRVHLRSRRVFSVHATGVRETGGQDHLDPTHKCGKIFTCQFD
jgi:hypothetical protein